MPPKSTKPANARKPRAAAPVQPSILPAPSEDYRKWRDLLNPLRGLTVKRAVEYLEAAQRGEMADYQYTMSIVEKRFPELLALISRRLSALLEMDWDIKIVSQKNKADPALAALAQKQADYLRGCYERIGNLYKGIETMAMAVFRGYGFAEKIYDEEGDIVELRPVAQWNLTRDGQIDRWKYNPNAFNYSYDRLTEQQPLDLSYFIHRTEARPLNELALILFIRASLGIKSWDAETEIFSLRGGVVTMPPNVAAGKEREYLEMARAISRGGNGVLPNGAGYTPHPIPRSGSPFGEHIKYIAEQLVLAGTGGKLTMLNDATGIGGSQGDVHADVFRQIARADARDINDVFQAQLDAEFLETVFPGQPALAYFELNFREEVEAGDVIDHAVKLAQAGFAMDAAELSEKTGYKLRPAPAPAAAPGIPGFGGPRMAGGQPAENAREGDLRPRSALSMPFRRKNRFASHLQAGLGGSPVANAGADLEKITRHLSAAAQKDLQPMLDRLARVMAAPDAEIEAQARQFLADLPGLLPGDDAQSIAAWETILSTAIIDGLTFGQAQLTQDKK